MEHRPLAIAVCGRTVEPLRPRRGDFPDWFRAGLGLCSERAPTVDLPAGERLPDPRELAGVVITGSPAMLTDGEPWMRELVDWTRGALAAELPLLGVCFGHQVLGQAGGGRIGRLPGPREIGTVKLRLERAATSDPLFEGLPPAFVAQASHSEAVLELPRSARRLARGDRDPNQAFALGSSAWGTQFHPEFDADIVRGYLEARRAECEAEGLDVDALLTSARDDATGRALLARFERLTRSLRA